MGDPFARASIVIGAPIERVRAGFFDVDRTVSGRAGVSVTLLSAKGARPIRLRQSVRVLGSMLESEIVVDEGDGEAWVESVVDGANAGAKLVARFEQTEGATRVEMEAHVPPSGWTTGVGKLSAVGVQRVLMARLEEHKRAIEGVAAPPAQPAEAAKSVRSSLDAIEAEVAAVRKLDAGKRRALAATVLEVACAVALADRTADDRERAVLAEVAHALVEKTLDDAARAGLVARAQEAIARGGIAARCEELGKRLRAIGRVELGLAVGALVARATGGVDAPEQAALERIANAAGMDAAALALVLKRVDGAST